MKNLVVIAILFVMSLGIVAHSRAEQQGEMEPRAYLPIVLVPEAFSCAGTSTNSYVGGVANQYDNDNPVRFAYEHADKNIELRGYTPNTDPSLVRELVQLDGATDPTQPPQLATLFIPERVPNFADFHRVNHWQWADSPDPGTRGSAITFPPVTAVSFTLSPDEPIHVPISGYDIGGGAEVIVIFADENTVTLHYTREDSAASGYTIHIDNICTDPNLLALYESLDDENGPRYDYPSSGYDLPALPAGKMIGTTGIGDMVVAIVDTGGFMDTRSCKDWWRIRPGIETCPSALLK